MALVAQAAAAAAPQARQGLDVGCGTGNYTLKLLEHLPNLDVTLMDLSQPMLPVGSSASSGSSRPIRIFEDSQYLRAASILTPEINHCRASVYVQRHPHPVAD